MELVTVEEVPKGTMKPVRPTLRRLLSTRRFSGIGNIYEKGDGPYDVE